MRFTTPRTPIGMYEGVGPRQQVLVGFVGVVIVLGAREIDAAVVAADVGFGCRIRPCVAGCSHQGTRVVCGCRGAGRLGCRGMYSRCASRMMGSLATTRLGSIS